MRRRGTLVRLVLGAILLPAGTALAAAVLIPDHTFRLGSCGGPEGAACTYDCGVGKSCAGSADCLLAGTTAFGAAMVARGDATPCGGVDPGVVLRFGLAGFVGATPFQIPDTAFDLCARDILCTGREPRACAACNDTNANDLLCTSDDGEGNFECPPGNLVFFCKDPCSSTGSGFEFFDETDVANLRPWFSETRQPLPAQMRAALATAFPSLPGTGRPVVYHAEEQLATAGDPPVTRLCVRVLYTPREQLGVCSSDARIFCSTAADCPHGDTCLEGLPPLVDPPSPTAVVSSSVCDDGTRAGRPCGGAGDCAGGNCVAIAPSASAKFCSGSLASCNGNADCPTGETCISCPAPACGDDVVDPGEECDDGDTTSGDGCDATCHVESCWTCDRVPGDPSFCFPSDAGTPCDVDGTSCTFDQCDGSGACGSGGAPSGCASAFAEKAQLQFKGDPAKPEKSKLKWKWVSGASFATSSLGDPSSTDAVTFCVYDAAGLRIDATAPADRTCGKKPCWDVEEGKAKYKDSDASPDGLAKLQAKSGDAGKGKVQLQGKGVHLVLPSAELQLPVQAYLVSGNGPVCLQATYSTANTNDPGAFKAKSD